MNNIYKVILFLIIFFCILFNIGENTIFAYKTITQQDMIVQDPKDELNIGGGEDVTLKDNFIKTAMDYLIGIVVIVAIGVFIYIGFELATAEGKQEKFTKGMKGLVYAGVGLAIIPLSYIVIKIVTGFNF